MWYNVHLSNLDAKEQISTFQFQSLKENKIYILGVALHDQMARVYWARKKRQLFENKMSCWPLITVLIYGDADRHCGPRYIYSFLSLIVCNTVGITKGSSPGVLQIPGCWSRGVAYNIYIYYLSQGSVLSLLML